MEIPKVLPLINEESQVSIKVGNVVFDTTFKTISKSPLLLKKFGDNNNDLKNIPFLDYDPKIFRHILNVLRDSSYQIPAKYKNELPKFLPIPQKDPASKNFGYGIPTAEEFQDKLNLFHKSFPFGSYKGGFRVLLFSKKEYEGRYEIPQFAHIITGLEVDNNKWESDKIRIMAHGNIIQEYSKSSTTPFLPIISKWIKLSPFSRANASSFYIETSANAMIMSFFFEDLDKQYSQLNSDYVSNNDKKEILKHIKQPDTLDLGNLRYKSSMVFAVNDSDVSKFNGLELMINDKELTNLIQKCKKQSPVCTMKDIYKDASIRARILELSKTSVYRDE